MTGSKRRKDKNDLNILYILLGILFIIWLASFGIIYALNDSAEARGQLGDSFGVINSLFSGLAFAGIIYTILLQKKELGYQREELKLTRDQLTRSAEAQEKSEIELRKQSENLKKTAKLNALNTLIVHYNERFKASNEGVVKRKYLSKINAHLEEIEEILGKKS